jgi:hypothetical protein
MRKPIFALALVLAAFSSCSSSTTSPTGDGVPTTGDYVVLAWNDLGMHCLNPTYDQAVVLPPYNNLWAQVIQRGNPPRVVTAGLTVEFSLEDNTFSYGKRDYGQFWDNAVALFGDIFGPGGLEHDKGLTGTGLSGEMEQSGDHFVAEAIPVVPVNDSDVWSPYQVAVIVVKNAAGDELIRTKAIVPVSDEIDCSKCHGADPWADIIEKHDEEHATALADTVPFLCALCHGSPALGSVTPGSSGIFLSKAIHGSHADRLATCYDCHPGQVTQCSRSERHTATGGNCETCHGSMQQVADRITGGVLPWVDEPRCAQCHDHSVVAGVATPGALYRNSTGHGGVYCAACHNSPHVMYPSLLLADNYQPRQYHGSSHRVKTIGSCGVCHSDSRGEVGEIGEFGEAHGGSSPEHKNACHTCHTVVPTDTSKWPHSYQWNNSND